MNNKGKIAIRDIVAIGIGAALFFVVGRFAAITVAPNTTANIQYGILSVFSVIFGPIVGCLTGLIGHTLIDASWGSPWWSWIIASAVFGLIMGFTKKKIDIENGQFKAKDMIFFNVVQVIAHGVCWVGVATGLDILIYAEPLDKLVVQSLVAWASNAITTAIVGTLLLFIYAKTRTSAGSLKKED